MAEILDCREVLLPAFETTKTNIMVIQQENGCATHCFHDGHLLEDGKLLKFEKLVFCSFSCALAHFPPEIHPRLHMTFPGLIYDIAPPRRFLRSFGGHLSLSQFRKSMEIGNTISNARCLYDSGDILLNEIVYLDGSFFCSNKCKLAYLAIFLPGSELETNIRSQSLVQEFPAPDRILLNIFGGPMSLHDFRAASYTLVLPPQYIVPGPTPTEIYSHYLVMQFDGNPKKPVVPRKQAYFPAARPKTNSKSKKSLTVLNNLPFQRKN